MSEWILILAMFGYREPSITFTRFESEAACKTVAAATEALVKSVYVNSMRWQCIKP